MVDHKRLHESLAELGFELTVGRHWYNAKLDMAIEAPGSVLDDILAEAIRESQAKLGKILAY